LQSFQGVKGLSKNYFFWLWGGGFFGFVQCRVKFIVKEVVFIFLVFWSGFLFCFWGVLLEGFMKIFFCEEFGYYG
jgi:hypothetical protein